MVVLGDRAGAAALNGTIEISGNMSEKLGAAFLHQKVPTYGYVQHEYRARCKDLSVM